MRHQGGASPAPTAACMSSDRPEAQCRAEAVLHRHAVARWQGAGEVVGADLDRGEGGAALRVDARAQGFDAGHVVYGAAPREVAGAGDGAEFDAAAGMAEPHAGLDRKTGV